MKKTTVYFLTTIFLFIGINSFAGEDAKLGGIRAGWQRATFVKDGNQYPGTDPLQSFYVGIYKYKSVAPLLSLGSGLEYFQNGIQVNDDNKLVLHYLSIPLNLKAKLGPVYGLGGLAPSFKVSEKEYVDGNKKDPDTKSKWFDAPVFLGAGVKILFISVEARYQWGLLEVDEGYKNQYFQLGAGISF